jgi:ferredoxin-NADP reductase
MEVTSHNSQHEAAEELALVTDSATVTRIEAMDRERHDEVIDAVKMLLEVYNEEDWLDEDEANGGDLDWDGLRDVLEPANVDSALAGKLDRLQNRYERDHPMLMSLRFRTEEPFDFVPGQYGTLRYDGTARPYSIASSPNSDETELCIRRVPDGSLTPKICDTLSEGDEITFRGPNGDFVMRDPSERDIVFIATGTGVAPFKSMIDYTFEDGLDTFEGEQRDIWLFLGCSWEDDLPYCEAFSDRADEHENFHFVPTLTREEYLSRWTGEADYVQQTLLKYLSADPSSLDEDLQAYLDEDPAFDIDTRIDPESTEVYACGINAMVYGVVDVVDAAGVPRENISCEGYG